MLARQMYDKTLYYTMMNCIKVSSNDIKNLLYYRKDFLCCYIRLGIRLSRIRTV